ncbi:MAG TPA: hypothetical protein VJI46_07610 [Candidatus Nanoarchaeia archaeon]|nr:hypothetical protein [Candidatus Nanoarchaeia archaeon]
MNDRKKMRNDPLYSLATGLLEKGYPRKEVKNYLLRHKFSSDDIERTLKDLDKGYQRHIKLVTFVKKQKKKGHSYESIRHHLIKHGISHEETHKAIGHVIASPKEPRIFLLLAVLSAILGLVFILPFLPPLGLVIALAVLYRSSDEKAKLIAKIAIIICIISIGVIAFLYFTRGTRTGLATGILAVSHDSIELSAGDSKKVFIYIKNDEEAEEAFSVERLQCAQECLGVDLQYPERGTIKPNSEYALPVKITASISAEAGSYAVEYAIFKGTEIENGQINLLLSSPENK